MSAWLCRVFGQDDRYSLPWLCRVFGHRWVEYGQDDRYSLLFICARCHTKAGGREKNPWRQWHGWRVHALRAEKRLAELRRDYDAADVANRESYEDIEPPFHSTPEEGK